MPEHKPVVAITMGDPAGCGPEIIAMAAAEKHLSVWPICVGDYKTMQRALQIVGSDIAAVPVQCIEDIDFVLGQLPIIDLENVNLDELEWGKIQQAAGQAAYEYITRAIDLAMTGQVGAVVTSAINKEALHLAVAGLNPHSGEGGVFGREEIEIIQPAIDLARSKGIDVVPYPAPPILSL